MNAAEPAVGHENDDVPVAVLGDNRRHDVVDFRNVPRVTALLRQIVDQLFRRQAL